MLPPHRNIADDFIESTALVRRDPSMAALALKRANASATQPGQTICSINRACDGLGASKCAALVREMASAASAAAAGVDDGGEFQQLAIVAGLAARCIGQSIGHGALDDLYTAALLHGLGQLALAEAFGDHYQRVSRGLQADARAEAERAAFGMSDPEAGTILAEAWRLPAQIAESIRLHRHAESAQASVFDSVVALAVVLAEISGSRDKVACRRAALRCKKLCGNLGISPAALPKLIEKLQQDMRANEEDTEHLRSSLASYSAAVSAASPLHTGALAAGHPAAPPEEPQAPAPPPVLDEQQQVSDEQGNIGWLRGEHRMLAGNPVDKRPALERRYAKLQQPEKQAEAPEAQLSEALELASNELPALLRKPYIWLPLASLALLAILYFALSGAGNGDPSDKAPGAGDVGVVMLPTGNGDEVKSVAELLSFVNSNPTAPETAGLLTRLGNHYYNSLKNYGEAAKFYQRLVDNFSSWSGTNLVCARLAECYERLNQTDAALAIYRRMLREFPEGSDEYRLALSKLEGAQIAQ